MKIGVFDSGYGGLTILQQIRRLLPEYDYIYLGDNARAPYGTRSYECIYHYTLDAVRYLFSQGCTLVILACNTASAKALRTIQQRDLPLINAEIRKCENEKIVNVLGVIRPTVEVVPSITESGHVGILATPATVSSESYVLELQKISNLKSPRLCRSKEISNQLVVTQQSCPMWVPLIEAGEHLGQGAMFFIRKYVLDIINRDPLIDTLVLGCTHYPLIRPQIDAVLADIARERGTTPCRTVAQGPIVADSLRDYLNRHPEYTHQLSTGGTCLFLTTDDARRFADSATLFLDQPILAHHVEY